MAFVDTKDLITYLGLNAAAENPDRLDQIVKYVNDWIVDQTGRDWAQCARTDSVRGNGHRELVLRHYPVASLTSCTVKDGTLSTTLDVTDPLVVDLVNPEQGILMRTDGDVWPKAEYRNVTIVYVGGPAQVPGYLTTAALEAAAYLYQTTGGRTGASTPEGSVQFERIADGVNGGGFKSLGAVRDAIRLAGDVLY